MTIGVLKEAERGENRVAAVPETVKRLVSSGAFAVLVEKGAGAASGYRDEEYSAAGAEISGDRAGLLAGADILIRLTAPAPDEVALMKSGALHVSFLDPFGHYELVEALKERGVTAVSMEMIPRSTVAQKMDALSSQASLAGYAAVIAAAAAIDKAFPMMMTPAGTIQPCRVFVIGAGVAGLQAIATAKRLGARVEAFDTRPVVEEQVQSLGAKFVKLDLGETGQTSGGYAVELTPEQLAKQRELMASRCVAADVVITTAKLFGKKAPVLVPAATVAAMKPGSVIVDLAVDSGGNVEGSRPDETVEVGGVRILGIANLPGRVAHHASQMYAANVANLLLEFLDPGTKQLTLDQSNPIAAGCVITRGGAIVNGTIRALHEKERTE